MPLGGADTYVKADTEVDKCSLQMRVFRGHTLFHVFRKRKKG